ncbi:MAG: formate/nitrite transporter family protein [Nitrospirales bacterium]|nr:formate/nitrite transporter family protein [Nitrospira sp.]MDR4500071.1 formate/nitrite transporter family protein [Nitrospirales bacterium]
MFKSDIERIMQLARQKVEYLDRSPLGYVVLSILAGVYLGFGITLIFSVGSPFAAEGAAGVKLIMGASFGVALTLVLFAGSELFTGNNMICAVGGLSKAISWTNVGWIFFWSYIGNAIGSLGIAWLVVQSGVLGNGAKIDLLMTVASMKMSLSGWDLFVRGVLCNWLVCLAVWMALRTKSEAARIMLIFWCLFAFVGSGFEHSIANQSLLGMALLLPHGQDISMFGFLWNQVFVGAGNLVGGAVFVGASYWLTSPVRVEASSRERSLAPPIMQGVESDGIRG